MPKKAKAGRGGGGGGRRKARGGGGHARDDRSGYQNRIRAKKLAEGQKSRGCPLTLLILSTPFLLMGLAVYWALHA